MTVQNKFDKYAKDYERLLNSSTGLLGGEGRYFSQLKAEYLVRFFEQAKVSKVLDYGCGVGLLSVSLRTLDPNLEVHGFDVSEQSIASIPVELRGAGIYTSSEEDLESDYDAVLVVNVLHHVEKEQRASLLRTVSRRVRTGGWIIVFEHNPANPLTQWSVKQCPFDDDAVLLFPSEVCGYFRAAGRMSVEKEYCTFFPPGLGKLRHCENLLRWCPLGAQYIVKARIE